MIFLAFLKGVAAGLLMASSAGAVGARCVQRTLAWGRLHGLLSGLGAAVADAMFAVVAAYGLSFVSEFLLTHQKWLRLGGGILLLALGIKHLLSKPPAPDVKEPRRSLSGDMVSAFVLTATNPITIISFLGVFAALGVTAQTMHNDANVLVAGVFTGSALWWLVLSGGVGLARKAVESLYLKRVHYVSGGLLIAFGVGVLAALAL